MFKKNTKHIQSDMFGMQNTMLEELKKQVARSEVLHPLEVGHNS